MQDSFDHMTLNWHFCDFAVECDFSSISRSNALLLRTSLPNEPQCEKTCLWVSDHVPDTNQAVQPQKMLRGLRFWSKVEEGLYYLCRENKDADQLHSY